MLRRLGRAAAVLFCVGVLAQQTGLGSLLIGDMCAEECPDDTAPKQCPPGCDDCACVGHGFVMAAVTPALVEEPLPVADVERPSLAATPDPQPESIFHVPRLALS